MKPCGCHYDLNTQELRALCPEGMRLLDAVLDANELVLRAEQAGIQGIEFITLQEKAIQAYQRHTGVLA